MDATSSSKYLRLSGAATIVTAMGAVAIGALAIGRLAIRHIAIERAKLKSVEMQDRSVTRLRVAEVTVTDSIQLPDSTNRNFES
jgi:hypothetical protein